MVSFLLHLYSLFSSSPTGRTDHSNPFAFTATHINKAACAACQITEEEIVGKSLKETGYFHLQVAENFRQIIQTGTALTIGRIRYVQIRPERTFLVKAFLLFEHSVAAVFEDVTE